MSELRSQLDLERASFRKQLLAVSLERDEARQLQAVVAADVARLEASLKCSTQEVERQRSRAAECAEKLRKATAKERGLEQAAEASLAERGRMERQLVAAAACHSNLRQRLDAADAELAEVHAAEALRRVAVASAGVQTASGELVDAVLLRQAERDAAEASRTVSEIMGELRKAESGRAGDRKRIAELAAEVASARADADAACSKARDCVVERLKVDEEWQCRHNKVLQELSAAKAGAVQAEEEWRGKLERVQKELDEANEKGVKAEAEATRAHEKGRGEISRLKALVERIRGELVDHMRVASAEVAGLRGGLEAVESTWDAVEARLKNAATNERELQALHTAAKDWEAKEGKLEALQVEAKALAASKEMSEAKQEELERALACAKEVAARERGEHEAAKAEIARLAQVQQALGLAKCASLAAWQQALDELQSIKYVSSARTLS
jgi:chromosome segregation ATPase